MLSCFVRVVRGHGTAESDGQLVATVCGVVERVNKLVYVRPFRARYSLESFAFGSHFSLHFVFYEYAWVFIDASF